MGALSFFSYFFLGLGPGLAFFCTIIAPKSFLVLLSFFSCFLWLVMLLFISAIFKGFEPFPETTSSFAGILLASVAMEEILRYGLWWMHTKGVTMLEGIARDAGHRFALVDRLYMALAWGFGHAACHSIFFFLSFLPLVAGDGTYYLKDCTQMSMFLIGALYSLAFGMILTSSMVVAFEGYAHLKWGPGFASVATRPVEPAWRTWFHVLFAPVLHVTAALVTLLNMAQDGCLIAQPVNLALGLASTGYAAHLAWTRGAADSKRQATARLARDSSEPLNTLVTDDNTFPDAFPPGHAPPGPASTLHVASSIASASSVTLVSRRGTAAPTTSM
ncbi:hypothetical protein FOA52_009225 [Chlamydomonas sp. UWO 241]|nr:hypothetical protein FOA52_009225 [Chlamydomonas sp. UWO 241]